VDNAAHKITGVPSGTTVGQLTHALTATDGSTQTYAVIDVYATSYPDGTTLGGGLMLLVRAQDDPNDASSQKIYTITVQ